MIETPEYRRVAETIREAPRPWLVTGGAGFIGSHLVQRLLELGQRVRCVDDFSSGLMSNLHDVRAAVEDAAWERFELIEGDLAEPGIAERALEGMEHVLHQAARGSVPRSVADPVASHRANVDAFRNLTEAARQAGVKQLVFASSSSVYGDEPGLPKREERTGRVLSPYAATKAMNETWAQSYAAVYPMRLVGLRYFNVFGTRQRPDGPYAAVIPRWIDAMRAGEAPRIFGDGEQSRDFTPVELVVQTNLTAALRPASPDGLDVVNVALGGRIDLNELEALIRAALTELHPDLRIPPKQHEAERAGDVRHSQADVSRLTALLGALPEPETAAAALRALVRRTAG